MNREQIDAMWQKAMHQSIADGEQFTRYHFYDLIASHVAEECAKVCEDVSLNANTSWKLAYHTQDQGREMGADDCACAIRSLYKPTA